MPRSSFLTSNRDPLRDDKLLARKKYGDKPDQNRASEQNGWQIHTNTKDRKTQPPIPMPGANGCAHDGLIPYYL